MTTFDTGESFYRKRIFVLNSTEDLGFLIRSDSGGKNQVSRLQLSRLAPNLNPGITGAGFRSLGDRTRHVYTRVWSGR